MNPELESVLARYPRLRNIIGKVPDDLVAAEVLPSVRDYEAIKPEATRLIRLSNLCDVFPPEAERGRIDLVDFLGQWGNVSVEELCKICLVVKWLDPRGIFEIGTHNGLSTMQMALNAPNAMVYTLDIKPDSPEAAALDIGGIDRYLAQKAGVFKFDVGHKFAGTEVARRIRQLWGDSTTFDFKPYEGRCNVVFIDAGHTYEYVKSDTERAVRLLDPLRDGAILWHDYDQVLHPDVTRCLCDFARGGTEIHHLRNTNLAIHRQRKR